MSRNHGYHSHCLYSVWKHVKYRCTNPNDAGYHHYGGRGIKICDEWLDPKVFIDWCLVNGWVKGLEIDRIDVNGHYEPSNCRFVDRSLQARNKRGYGSTSPYRNVYWHKASKKWIARAYINKKQIYLGLFANQLDALGAINDWNKVNMPNNPELIQEEV